MKVLVFGKTGQVARELQRHTDVTALNRGQADLSDPNACAKIIAQTDADVIINAAAYTAVDKAETEQNLAQIINADTPTAMAKSAALRKLPFLQISTDYVFDGTGTASRTTGNPTAPINVYGRTKLVGEAGVIAAGGTVLRTSWVFSAYGTNFVKTMLRLGKDRDNLNVVDDQIGGPTAAADIAVTLLRMAAELYSGKGQRGVYHYAGVPDVSWKDFATQIFEQSGVNVDVTGIPTSKYPTPAMRPLNSCLDCSALENVFGITRPDWQVSLAAVLEELGEI